MPTRRTGHGGVQVRVFGGGPGDRRRSDRYQASWGEAELEDDPGEIEEVVRLDLEAIPLANRRIEGEEAKLPVPLRKPRRKRVMSVRALTVLMACLTVVLSVIVVLAVGSSRKVLAGPESYLETMKVVDVLGVETTEADELIDDAVKLFGKFAAAETLDEAIGTIRHGERLKSKMAGHWEPLGEAADVAGQLSGMEDVTVVLITGKQVAGDKFEYLLVSGDDGFKVDWEASKGVGDLDFDQLKDLEIGKSVKMRVLLKAATFHPLDFPDEEFRCYRMSPLEGSSAVFGYARVGSDVVRVLAEALNEGSVLLDEVSDCAAIVRIENTGRGELGQFTITDVIEKGWVEP